MSYALAAWGLPERLQYRTGFRPELADVVFEYSPALRRFVGDDGEHTLSCTRARMLVHRGALLPAKGQLEMVMA